MTIYTSVEAARTALREHDEERKSALATAREIADRAKTGGERESDRQDFDNALDRYDKHSKEMHEAARFIDARKQDAEADAAFEGAARRLGNRNTMSRTPESQVRFGRPFQKGQGFVDFVPEKDRRSLADAGLYMRAMILGDYEARATLVEGTDTLGGHMVPVQMLAPVLDLARAKTVLAQAGATFTPLSSMTAKMPRHDADPVFAARDESGAYNASDTTLGSVLWTPRSYATIIKIADELLEDASTDVGAYLATVVASAAAVTLDQQGLYGTGTPPAIKGVKNVSGVTITHAGVAGASLTSYDLLVDLVARLRTANYEPTALVTSPGVKASLGKLRAVADGQYMAVPPYLSGIPFLDTSSVPTNLAVGASGNVCSDVIAADWSKVVVGVRQELRVRRLGELYAATGETAVAVDFRADLQVTRTGAVQILDGIID